MAEPPVSPSAAAVRWRRVLVWSLALLILEGAAFVMLSRLRAGRLFLFALPWDAPASEWEITAATKSATTFHWPAIAVIAVIWALLALGSAPSAPVGNEKRTWLWRSAFALLLLGTLADLVTTFAFFHRDGVDQELHPGIRLVSYSLGRSVGPIVTKLIQFSGIYLIGWRWPKIASILFAIAGAAYLAGAIYNVLIALG